MSCEEKSYHAFTVYAFQPARGVFGKQELSDAPPGVGQRHGDGVPAIEYDRAIGRRLAAAPGRPGA